MTIASNLRDVRAVLGLKQTEMADQSGVSYRVYQHYEGGRSVPGGEAIAGFVRMGINANWLLTGEGPMLLKDLAPPPAPAPQINAAALGAILQGVMMTTAGASPARQASLAVEFYLLSVAKGNVTPTEVIPDYKLPKPPLDAAA